jgi:hypothetical protein
MSKKEKGLIEPKNSVKVNGDKAAKKKAKVDHHLAGRVAWLVIYKAKADKAEGKEKEKLLEKRAALAKELGIKID